MRIQETSIALPLAALAALTVLTGACSKTPSPSTTASPSPIPSLNPSTSPSPNPSTSPSPSPSPSTSTDASPSTPEDAPPLAVGDPAPEVTFALQDGKTVALGSLRGQRVLVYFYPKDDTPGCTVEAQGLRDRYPDLQAAGVAVYGVSLQDAASHQAFIAKHDLPFPLVVDDGGKVAAAFHVPLRGPGLASRQSFLVGKDGRLEAVWLKVDPSTHAADVLAALPTAPTPAPAPDGDAAAPGDAAP